MRYFAEVCWLASALLFMLSLKWLGSPKTARRANFISMLAMALAVLPPLLMVFNVFEVPLKYLINNAVIIGGGVMVGAGVGLFSAKTVKMTSMPQMVALYNGFGGGASLLVAILDYLAKREHLRVEDSIPVHLSIVIGGVCLTGSVAAFAKLQELISGKPVLFGGQHLLNAGLAVAALLVAVYLTIWPGGLVPMLLIVLLALALGWLVVIPIGGADMPVVISLMNSYSGMAVTATGFVLQNSLLIIVGSLVGASGIILTQIMCKAMNRSLANVMFGGFGGGGTAAAAAGGEGAKGNVKEAQPEEAASIMANAQSMIVVPGYGMAVAQAQHAVRELAELLQKKGVTVKYAIHPVAGRMPGHMNVLLAEANVPYDALFELDAINDEFARTDVSLVVGANDVVNPAAKSSPSSPIYGMPVLNVEQSKAVIVLKRSMNPGFAGIDNDLFVQPNTMMVFGDAKATLGKIAQAVKEGA